MSKHSFEFKKKVVLEYSDGKGGVKYLSKKYGLGSNSQLHKWIKAYKAFGDEEITGLLSNDVDFNNFLIEWNEMRTKHYNNEITDEEFKDWKLSYPKN